MCMCICVYVYMCISESTTEAAPPESNVSGGGGGKEINRTYIGYGFILLHIYLVIAPYIAQNSPFPTSTITYYSLSERTGPASLGTEMAPLSGDDLRPVYDIIPGNSSTITANQASI